LRGGQEIEFQEIEIGDRNRRSKQEIEFQEIETGDQNYYFQNCSRDRMYLWLICKIVQEIEKALGAIGGHFFRVFSLT
jgi:hypothetical protein